MEGIDYSFGSGLTARQIRGAGKHFVARYVAGGGNPKELTLAEARNLLHAGLAIVLVWETWADRMLAGRAAGHADAATAGRQAAALAMPTIPVYFACDFDASPAQQGAIDAYLDGAAAVLGRHRTGIYGGYWPVTRAMQGGHAGWGWQTYAWSGGLWHPAAHLRQYADDVALGPAQVDLNRAMAPDYGQWPRPAPP